MGIPCLVVLSSSFLSRLARSLQVCTALEMVVRVAGGRRGRGGRSRTDPDFIAEQGPPPYSDESTNGLARFGSGKPAHQPDSLPTNNTVAMPPPIARPWSTDPTTTRGSLARVVPFKSLLRGTNVRMALAPLLGLRLAARRARERVDPPRNGWRPFAIGGRGAYIRRRGGGTALS